MKLEEIRYSILVCNLAALPVCVDKTMGVGVYVREYKQQRTDQQKGKNQIPG